MLVPLNMTMELLNVRKNKRTIECDKSTVTCDVGTAQYKDDTIKCEKKKRQGGESPNVKKISHM